MADEQGVTVIGGVEAEVRALRQDVTGLKVDVAEIKGTVSQMDKRLSSVETTVRQEVGDLRKDNRQSFNWMLGMWITTILSILTMSLTILSRIR